MNKCECGFVLTGTAKDYAAHHSRCKDHLIAELQMSLKCGQERELELIRKREELVLQLKEATAFAYEEAARLLENEVIAGNQVAGVALSIGRLRLWAKDRRAKLKSKGVFCLEHSRVMVDGICPKCAGQPA